MSDQGLGTRRRWVLSCAAAAVALGCMSCASPLGPRHVDEGPEIERRLRRIEPLNLEAVSQPPGAGDPPAPIPVAAPTPAAEVRLTIEECRALALENNLDLQVQLISPAIIRQQVTEAEAAFESLFFANVSNIKTDTPTSTLLSGTSIDSLNAEAGFRVPLRTGGVLTLSLPVSRTETNNMFSILNPAYTSDAVLSFSQPLLRNAGFRTNEHFIRIAQWNRQRSEAETKLAIIGVLATTERIYWELYAARRQLIVRRQELELAQSLLERARRLVNAGAASEVEIIRAEAGVAERAEAIIIAENAVRDRQRDLKRLLNKPGLEMNTPTIIIPVTEPNPVLFQLDADRMIIVALAQRMEMLELELRLLQDASSVDFARNQKLPVLLAEYGYFVNGLGGTFGESFDLLGEKRFESHRVGGRLEVPLGNEAAESRLRSALLTRLQTIATKQQRRAQITQEVLNAMDQMLANWQRILASQQRTILAARVLEAEQRQFEQGLRTSTDVLDAQTKLGDAQSAEISAVTSYQVSQIDIAFATGMLLGSRHVRWEPAGLEPQVTEGR